MPARLKEYYKRLNNFLFPTFPSHAGEYHTFKKKVTGVTLNYAKTGKGPAVIFIHGWTNNWEGWIPIVKYLEKDFTLYLMDIPGFGDSDALLHYSVEISADHIACFMQTLGQKPMAIVGLSMGSFVAFDVAFRYPKTVNCAILTGPVIKDGRHKIIPQAFDIFLKAVHRSRFSEKALKMLIETRAAAYLLAKYLNMYKFKKDLVDAYGMVGKKKVRKEAYVEMGISASSYDLKKKLETVSIPALLVMGKEDRYTKPEIVRKTILPANKNLKLEVIPDAGHVVPWEKPKEVAKKIKGYLSPRLTYN